MFAYGCLCMLNSVHACIQTNMHVYVTHAVVINC